MHPFERACLMALPATLCSLLWWASLHPRVHRYLSQNLSYASYLTRHKYFVFRAGLRVGAPLWRLLLHDWSKVLPDEWVAYRHHFYREDKNAPDPAFYCAWLKHVHRNPHHWEHWVRFKYGGHGGHITATPFVMPEALAREMVADWLGANRVIHGEYRLLRWYYGEGTQVMSTALCDCVVRETAELKVALPQDDNRNLLMVTFNGHVGEACPTPRYHYTLFPGKGGHKYKMKLHPETRVLVEKLLLEHAAPLEGKR